MANPEIVLDGDVSPFRRALREAGADLAKFGKDGEKSLEGFSSPLGKLASRFALITTGIAAFIAMGQKALGVSAELNESADDLGNALGISATKAGDLNSALAREGVTTETFVAAAQKLSANLKENESDLNKMGLATRDAAGNLRPLNDLTVDAIELVGKYKAGTDRAIAANTLFGKGFEINGDLAKINNEQIAHSIEEQKRLGSQITEESVAAFGEYEESMKSVHSTLTAFWQQIGNVLMPVLTDLGNWFSAIGPGAITVIKGALGGLAAMFHFVTTGVTVLWETINALVISVAEPIRALGSSLAKAMSGDYAGAVAEMKGIGTVISDAWSNAFDVMAAKAQSTRDRISAIFSEGTIAAAPAVEGRSANALVKKDEKKKEEKSSMPEYEAKLNALKMAASDENALREYSKAQELAYWNSVLQMADVTAKDRMAIEKKVTDLTLAVRKEAIQQGMALKAQEIQELQSVALARVDIEEAAAQAALDAESITKVQALALEQEHENRRYQIKLAALEANLQLATLDPNTSPVELARIHAEIEQLEMQHQARRLQMSGRMTMAVKQQMMGANSVFGSLAASMSSLWDKGMDAMMNGTFRWRNAFRAVGAELTRWFITNVVGAQVKEYLAGQARMVAAKILGLGQEETAQAASSTKVAGIKGVEATAVGSANAVEAGSGAAAAMSGVPYVGPILALAAMAAVFGAVMSMTGKVKSAAGGYDIPAGLNPMTQLHEEEMVLPKEYANTIRGLAAGQGGDGGGFNGTVNLYPRSGRWTKRDRDENIRLIADGLKELYANGWRPS